MNERLRVNICMLVAHGHDRVKRLRGLAENADLEEILGDSSLKWVRSKKCPSKHAAVFAEAVGYIHGAARALGIAPSELAAQLLDEDGREDAEILGTVAQYANAWRTNPEK